MELSLSSLRPLAMVFTSSRFNLAALSFALYSARDDFVEK
jgi:hypothetical protein